MYIHCVGPGACTSGMLLLDCANLQEVFQSSLNDDADPNPPAELSQLVTGHTYMQMGCLEEERSGFASDGLSALVDMQESL